MFDSKSGFLDRLVGVLDTGLRTVTGQGAVAEDPEVSDVELSDKEKQTSVELMRINHAGEVCAQGLYEGQALVTNKESVRTKLLDAADEERNHLLWCNKRLQELEGSTSLLVPFFYGMSVCVGAVAGLVGDRVSLGFVEATEDQVCKHLDQHLDELSWKDVRSRAILEKIRKDEKRHGQDAIDSGGVKFPGAVKSGMTLVSKVMTESTRRI